jgi:hypothetical protein
MKDKEFEEYKKNLYLADRYTKQPMPEIGKEYNYYDDGKIRQSRHSIIKILNIIKIEEASRFITEFFERIKNEYDWIFSEKQDYFIIGYNEKDCPGVTMLFARSNLGWYGFETSGEDYWSGSLITHPDFDPNKV